MKIMIVADNWASLDKGSSLINEMLNAGYEVICVLPDSEAHAVGGADRKNLKFCFISQKRRRYVPACIKVTIYCLMGCKVLNPDKILIYFSKQTMAAGFAFRMLLHAPFSVIVCSLRFLQCKRGFIYKRICRYLLKISETVFFIYKDDYEAIDRFKLGCKERSLMLGSWGVDMNFFAKVPMPQTDLVYMAMPVLCRYGVRCFIETAKLVRKKYPKVRFLISGIFIEDPLILSSQEFDEACEKNHIYYIQDVDDIRPYLEVCSIFVQPNIEVREGYIIEAEAAGRPILASDQPVNRSLVIEGYNGFLLPVFDESKWADKITLLLENKKLRTNMAEYSHELCSRWHDRRKINKLIIENLQKTSEDTL